MASRFIDVPLGLELHFPDYPVMAMDLSSLPCPALVRDLARALLARTNTGGTIKAPATARIYRNTIRHAVRWFAAQGFAGGAAELTETLVFDYWRRCGPYNEAHTRNLLSGLEEAAPGRLTAAVVRQLRGVPLNQPKRSSPRQPLSAAEAQRLLVACKTIVEAAEARLAAGQALVDRGRDPASDWRAEANLAQLLDQEGPHDSKAIGRREGVEEWKASKALTTVLMGVHEALFPTNDDALAFRLLVGLQTGICPEGVDGLRVDCVEWISATDARISWCKARASGRENHVFASRGPWSPGRLIQRWLVLSERARRFAPDPTALWQMCDAAHLRIRKPVFGWDFRDSFVARHGLKADDGTPMPMRFGVLRATYFARHDRHWNGALRIDPNHSSRVEGDHYLAQTRASGPIEATIEAAQHDALRKAALAPLTVLGLAELAVLDDDRAAAAVRLGTTEDVAAEVLSGQRDVFAAACKDFHHSPHGQPGAPCPAPVWTCLLCPLAVFTPTKVPNLLRLRSHLDRQWKALGTDEWLALYGPAQLRLDRDILPLFDSDVIDAARAAVDADDDAPLYLRPEENPTWPA